VLRLGGRPLGGRSIGEAGDTGLAMRPAFSELVGRATLGRSIAGRESHFAPGTGPRPPRRDVNAIDK